MFTLDARNVHEALPRLVGMLSTYGVRRESRNGPVLALPEPITIAYRRPTERLGLWAERDINTAFLVAEALWMLAGRNDLGLLTRYISDFGRFSDDGTTLHGAYGHRWRRAFGVDQLDLIVNRLKTDPTDRRSVLQIWDAARDLDATSKDLPCNDTATFQINADGKLDLAVFNRSNDVVWGTCFANAFQFGTLIEYMAARIGCPVGTYYQISANLHGYVDTLTPLLPTMSGPLGGMIPVERIYQPYADGLIPWAIKPHAAYGFIDSHVNALLQTAEMKMVPEDRIDIGLDWYEQALAVLLAHAEWKKADDPYRFAKALNRLNAIPDDIDITVSMRRWLRKREAAWTTKTMTA